MTRLYVRVHTLLLPVRSVLRTRRGDRGQTTAEYALVLLGVAAIEEGSGKRLDWDGKTGRFTHDAAANKFLSRPNREGWGLS